MRTDRPDPGPSTLDVRVEGPIAWVRFDRPDARNTVIARMVVEMHAVLTELSRDQTVTVVVLTGTGRTFCPGADLNRFGDEPTALPPPEVYQSATLLHEMPQVTIAAVNGACAGAGFAWAAACDLRVAAEGAGFSTAFLPVGVAGELGLPWTVSRALGGAMAWDLCFLPRKLTASQARAAGFVSRVFPDERFGAEVDALVRELAVRRPAAVRALKTNFLLAERTALAEYIEAESRRHHEFFSGPSLAQTAQAMRAQGERVRGD